MNDSSPIPVPSEMAGPVKITPQRGHNVEVYARHSADCNQVRSSCRCPKYLYVAATQQRLSAKTRSWEEAEKKKRDMEAEFDPAQRELKRLREKEHRREVVAAKLISDAMEAWLDDLRDTWLPKDPATGEFRPSSLEPYLTLQRQFEAYLTEHKIFYLSEITLDVLMDFRKTWKTKYGCVKQNAREKKQMKLAHFLAYCVRRDWLDRNIAGGGKKSKLGLPGGEAWLPMVAFTDAQMEIIYAACDKLGRKHPVPEDGRRVRIRQRALIDVMVDSGMAIRDAVTMKVAELGDDGEIEARNRAKTGKEFITGVTAATLDRARAVEPGDRDDPDYIFKGTGSLEHCTKRYYNQFTKLWKLCDPPLVLKNGHSPHPHMLRCTFAVRYLRKHLDAGIYPLSKILGTTVAIIEKHYVPMVPELKEIIRAHRRAAFNTAPTPPAQPGKVFEFKRRARA